MAYVQLGDPILSVTSTISAFISAGGQMAEMKKKADAERRIFESQQAHERRLLEKEGQARQAEASISMTAAAKKEAAIRKLFYIAGSGILIIAGIITVGVVLIQNKSRKGGK